ncbi:NADH dehydrogenase [ubiquinone] 1 beta subcomplex subunit 9-like isoform X2 [Salvia miltiorrhiza]|uniref:NADH dehydrogenase [ubiquinone] 1 beta subcomplex subunit 9-like isoform X1 n=1 Tax=Salvia miltiorrhiza TaxID=226208 RepID=UPI0025AD087E|nr:NADH dehydrogenase [ubiquinone] 1 beta subcomplex subunit 9-like isoform X1 [Salvia miltiorrhiza]XP_057783145.1 NADH dehydrogenase [ubiquinone] 1 beta subcomplex subunit 9-like isoform X2 [Salvia miltiorrhiza]
MSVTTASYVARRAAQKERVRILYRRALKDTLNWAVHRHLFYHDADALREKFEANRQVEDIELIDKMIAAGEASHDKWRHPDPYIVRRSSPDCGATSNETKSFYLWGRYAKPKSTTGAIIFLREEIHLDST